MFTITRHNSHTSGYTRARRTQRGQSIVVALLVLLLLGLAGALFVTIIARNLINAGHANRVQTADNYAAAGIAYADAQLTNSIDGADWRPPLQYQLAVPPTEARELARYNAVKATLTDPTVVPYKNDPDLSYLTAGFSRYNTGAGRYLVRVTYTPILLRDASGQYYDPVIGKDTNGNALAPVSVPPGKYLKIEAIGREGVIDPVDPTTYSNNRSADKTQSTLVAYKPIGITDYARFETNPDKRSDIANLGVVSQFYASNADGGIATPGVSDFNSTGSTSANGTTPPTITEYPVVTTYGSTDAYLKSAANGTFAPNPNAGGGGGTLPAGYTVQPGGGSIHANMPLRFFGRNLLYLNDAAGSAPLFQDTVEVYGDLLLSSYDPNVNLDNSAIAGQTATTHQSASLILNPTATTPTPLTSYVAPSNGGFDTRGGLIRDSSLQNDAKGLPRSITRLDPPLMDSEDSATQMPRYRAIAMNSSPRSYTTGATTATYPASASQYGYGKAIYVNNPKDVQTSSTTIGGGSTLTDEWLNRTAAKSTDPTKGGWNGLFYNPPGVSITLGQLITPPANNSTAGVYGIRLVRSAGDNFVMPDGKTNAGQEMDVSYTDLSAEATNTSLNAGTAPDNDIVIYAEGNVRVRGIASPDESTPMAQAMSPRTPVTVPRHITIVTNGTAYIEGNLLKGDPDSTISVLAHDYVCINTTQFLAGTVLDAHTDGTQPAPLPLNGQDVTVTLAENESLVQTFNFGLTGTNPSTSAMPSTPTKYTKSPNNSVLALYIAAAPETISSTDYATADIDIIDSTLFATGPPKQPALTVTFTALTHTTFDLSTLTPPLTSTTSVFNALGTDMFQLSVRKNPGQEASASSDQNVALQRGAVLPMDIRIEAVLYAQTGSFFVIPGDWFNLNNGDTLTDYFNSFQYASTGSRPDIDTLSKQAALTAAQVTGLNRFPMFGQPIDLKITIDGSVSEARPADIAAQTAWMQKWGWIPQYHGSLVFSSSGGGAANNGVESAGHTQSGTQPAIGLQIIYDSQAGYPYHPGAGTANDPTYYLRSDVYGRPLPVSPKLPVSTGLLYSGQSGEAPLLQ